MKRGFTLVELIVSIVIVSLISGGALVYLNKFNSRQKLEKGKDEVVATIKMIQTSAKARQLPNLDKNWSESTERKEINELLYISFYTFNADDNPDLGLILKAHANEAGDVWYYRNPVKNIGATDISISSPAILYPSTILFGAGTGRLIGDTGGTPVSDSGTAVVIIKNEAEIKEGYKIIINAMGQIKEVKYYEE